LTQEPWSISDSELVNIVVVATNSVGDGEIGRGSVRMPDSPDVILISAAEEVTVDSASISWLISADDLVKTKIHLFKGSRSAEPVAFMIDDGFTSTY
jgi:hypothetical protein